MTYLPLAAWRTPSRKRRRLLQLDRPVRVIEERSPRFVLFVGELQVQHRAAFRLFRLAHQAHVGLLGSSASLANVAVHAGADDVLPRALAPLRAGNHVVEAQLRRRKLPAT